MFGCFWINYGCVNVKMFWFTSFATRLTSTNSDEHAGCTMCVTPVSVTVASHFSSVSGGRVNWGQCSPPPLSWVNFLRDMRWALSSPQPPACSLVLCDHWSMVTTVEKRWEMSRLRFYRDIIDILMLCPEGEGTV